MKAKNLVLVVVLFTLGTSLALDELSYTHLGFYTIQASNGKYLGLCNPCGKPGLNAYSILAASDDPNDPNNRWAILIDQYYDYYLQASNNRFLGI